MSEDEDAYISSQLDDLFIPKEALERARIILAKRYGECDSRGHKQVKKGRCTHCYRHAHYDTPKTDAMSRAQTEAYAGTSDMQVPVNASYFDDLREDEIRVAKMGDRFEGEKEIALNLLEKNKKGLRGLLRRLSS